MKIKPLNRKRTAWYDKPVRSAGRLAQLSKQNRKGDRDTEAVALWRTLEPNRRDIFR